MSSCGCTSTASLTRRPTPAGWPTPATFPGGQYFEGTPLAGLRSLFYVGPTSTQLKPWAKFYRDFSDLMGQIVAVIVPYGRFPPQVLVIDALKRDDGNFARDKARELAKSLNFNAAIVGVVGAACAIIPGLQPVAVFAGPGAAVSAALAAVLNDYADGRPIDVGTLARAVVTMVSVIGVADRLPPELRSAADGARSNPAVQAAGAAFVARTPVPQSSRSSVNVNNDAAIAAFARFTLRNPTRDPASAPAPAPGTYDGKYSLNRAKFFKVFGQRGRPSTTQGRAEVWRSLNIPAVQGAIVEALRTVPVKPGQRITGPATMVPTGPSARSTPSAPSTPAASSGGVPTPVIVAGVLLALKVLL